jgi:glycerol-3-phosphate acyltransferase PlsY
MLVHWSIGLAIAIAAYLLGSLPTGYLAGRWLRGIDIRDHGSGSTGATNVLRTLGKPAGSTVLAIDVLKGAIAVLGTRWAVQTLAGGAVIASFDLPQQLAWWEVIAAIAALIGHSKPIWLKFRGGKSVATGLGILLALAWPVGLTVLAVFCITLALSRIVSLSSIAGALAVSGVMLATQQPLPYCLFALAAGFYVIWRHRSNINRILDGIEPRLGQGQPTTK